MTKFYVTATLMILQGMLFSYAMAQSGSGSGSGDDESSTTIISPTPTSTPSSSSVVAPTTAEGPQVTLKLKVSINCSANLQNLTDTLEDEIEQLYKSAKFPISTVKNMASCENSVLYEAVLTLSFNTGIPSGKTIKGVFDDALKNRTFSSLTESNTISTITFAGVTLKYSPKAGQCQAICCDGAGGELTVEQVCTPDNKCEGIESDEKEEDGHCPGDSKATCPDTCESDGSRNNLPSFAVIILLVLTQTIFC